MLMSANPGQKVYEQKGPLNYRVNIHHKVDTAALHLYFEKASSISLLFTRFSEQQKPQKQPHSHSSLLVAKKKYDSSGFKFNIVTCSQMHRAVKPIIL